MKRTGKVSGGSILIEDDAVGAGTVTGGAIIIASGKISVGKLSGGGVLISAEKVTVDKAHAAADYVAAPEVEIKNGDVERVPLENALEENRKLGYSSLESKRSKAHKVLNKTNKTSDESRPWNRSKSKTQSSRDYEESNSKDESEAESKGKQRSEEYQALDNVDLPEREIAAVIAADVLGLFCEDSEQYHRDKRIILEAHPELEPIIEDSTSVDEAVELARKHERLEFTDRQIELMRQDESVIKSESEQDVSFEELIY